MLPFDYRCLLGPQNHGDPWDTAFEKALIMLEDLKFGSYEPYACKDADYKAVVDVLNHTGPKAHKAT